MASFTESFSFSETRTGPSADLYTLCNTIKYNLFTALIASPPTGWVLSTYSIPTPSSSAHGAYSATFIIDGTFSYKVYTSTSSSYYPNLYGAIGNAAGTTIAGGSCTLLMITGTTLYTVSCDISMSESIVSGTYRLYNISDVDGPDSPSFGQLFLEEAGGSSPDFFLFINGTNRLFDTGGASYYTVGPVYPINNGGTYFLFDAYIYIGSGYYAGKIKNAKCLCNITVSSGPVVSGRQYTIGSTVYTAVTQYGKLLIN